MAAIKSFLCAFLCTTAKKESRCQFVGWCWLVDIFVRLASSFTIYIFFSKEIMNSFKIYFYSFDWQNERQLDSLPSTTCHKLKEERTEGDIEVADLVYFLTAPLILNVKTSNRWRVFFFLLKQRVFKAKVKRRNETISRLSDKEKWENKKVLPQVTKTVATDLTLLSNWRLKRKQNASGE